MLSCPRTPTKSVISCPEGYKVLGGPGTGEILFRGRALRLLDDAAVRQRVTEWASERLGLTDAWELVYVGYRDAGSFVYVYQHDITGGVIAAAASPGPQRMQPNMQFKAARDLDALALGARSDLAELWSQ